MPAKKVVAATGATTVNGQFVDFKVNGSTVMIDGATIVTTDIECSNGVIHVIDAVILPASENIVATAQSAGQFGTLLAAAQAAGLAELLQSEGPFTVLAPTDEAFAKLPQGTVEMLLKPENKDKLATILKYHVIPGRVYSPDALKAGTASTALGKDVRFTVRDGKAYANNARIVATDIDASNGTIHVIDQVILPE
jgi:uncharacterized surface protein with fasciclin (FAS1) repeats